MSFRARFPLSALLATALALGGCGAQDTTDGSATTVAAAFYPLEFAVGSVAGDLAAVTPLTTPGVEAHDVELTARQVAAVVRADLVVYLAGFQPAVDAAVREADPSNVLDVGTYADLLNASDEEHVEDGDHTGHEHGDIDPHFWLDPLRLAAVSDAIADRLASVDPDHADLIARNAARTRTELEELDEEFRAGLAQCERHTIFTSHSAFGYLAERYGLEQVSVVGISPDLEPSGARIAEVQRLARESGATTIFFETTASDAVAKSIAGDLGLETAVLDPIESLSSQSAGADYPAIMRANLVALRKANNCG